MAQKIQPSVQFLPQLILSQVRYIDLTFDRHLGGGGFGDVFRGTWEHTVVAIKKLKIHNLTSDQLEGFKQEAILMSRLRHPHIVSFFRVCTEISKYWRYHASFHKNRYVLLRNGAVGNRYQNHPVCPAAKRTDRRDVDHAGQERSYSSSNTCIP